MSVATTSIHAYQEHRDSGKVGRQARTILFSMPVGVSYSRRELAELTGIEISSICGRVNELVSIGLLEETPTRRCRITGKSVHPVRRLPSQPDLFYWDLKQA